MGIYDMKVVAAWATGFGKYTMELECGHKYVYDANVNPVHEMDDDGCVYCTQCEEGDKSNEV